VCPVMFSFQNTLHCQGAHATEWSIHGPLSRYKRCSKQCLAWYPLQYALTCCHRPLLQLLEVLPPQDPTTREASMPSVLELLFAKTTTSALQLEVHLQVANGAPDHPRWLSHAWGGHWTNLLHLSTECYVMWAHLQCVSVVAIRTGLRP
jgi:hypothetical protein